MSYLFLSCTERNCLNCTEHVCIKGDKEKTKRLQDRLKKEKILWQKDKHAVEKNVTGAKMWLETRELTIQRCEQLVALLNDPNIPDGVPLSLPPSEEVTHLELAYQKAGQKRLPIIENKRRNNLDDIHLLPSSDSTGTWIL